MLYQCCSFDNVANVLVVSSAGISREEFTDNVATEILAKLPEEYDLIKVKRVFGAAITPSVIVLFQELERFNKLISRIRITLTQLRKVRERKDEK